MSTTWRDIGSVVSSICGVTYFLAWSASFYPQPLLNYRQKSTQGLTPDFPLLNVIGFACYSTSTLLLLLSESVRTEYASRHELSPEPIVRWNDAAFGVHALLLCLITYSQFWPDLWGWKVDVNVKRQVTIATRGIVAGASFAVITVACIVLLRSEVTQSSTHWAWLDVVYCLQYIKLLLTFFKYLPQAIANYKRRSTKGWSIGQIQLDFAGGILSLVQLIIDSAMQADWSGLTGNPVKFGLANISLAFDIIFLVQHFVFYGPIEHDIDDIESVDEQTPFLR